MINLKAIRKKYKKENKTEEWNSFINQIRDKIKDIVKYYQKMQKLDQKAIELKKNLNKNYPVINYATIQDEANYLNFIEYITFFDKTIYDKYYKNELARQEYKYTMFKIVGDFMTSVYGATDEEINNYFKELMI